MPNPKMRDMVQHRWIDAESGFFQAWGHAAKAFADHIVNHYGDRFQENAYGARHGRALLSPDSPWAASVIAWCDYADAHQQRYDSLMGQDGVLGPAWIQWGKGLRALLDGELGQLDAGLCLDLLTEIATAVDALDAWREGE
jgi:hypothetical protein